MRIVPPTPIRAAVALLSALVLLAPTGGATGCGSGADDDDGCHQEPPNPDADGGGLVCGQPFELNEANGDPGVFGVKVVEYVHVNAAGIVETDTISQLLVLGYVDYHPETLDADIGIQLCQILIPKVEIPGQPEPTVFNTLPQMLPNIPRVQIKASMSGDTTCEQFVSEKAITVIGACLEDQLNDPLPSDARTEVCPGTFTAADKDTFCDDIHQDCMYDLDEDGLPATTLTAENVPGLDVDIVYGTMRSWISMEGLVATSDLILGVAYWSLEMQIVGCRLVPIGGGDLRDCTSDEVDIVAQINPDLTQTPGQDSTFQAVRVRPDMDCYELIDRELEIFGR